MKCYKSECLVACADAGISITCTDLRIITPLQIDIWWMEKDGKLKHEEEIS